MRRLTAISLSLLLLFNLFGYRVVLQCWEVQENIKLIAKLDRQQYDEKDLVELKIPIQLPYHSNWNDFERYDGEIDINGVHYKYVKRKIYNDSLILLCIPNEEKTKLRTARDEFFSLVNNLQKNADNQESSHPPLSTKFSGGDYICQQTEDRAIIAISNTIVYSADKQAILLTTSTTSPWQPPDYLQPYTC